MKNLIKFVVRTATAVALVCGAALNGAHAAVNNVSAAPSSVVVSQITPNLVQVTWTVSLTQGGLPGRVTTQTVQSTSGVVVAGGNTVQAIPQLLQQSITGIAGSTQVVQFSETISVSPVVAAAISQAGSGVFSRSFNDSFGAATGQVSLVAQSASAAPSLVGAQIGIANLELNFEDQSRYASVLEGTRLVAEARLVHSGRGTLVGRWEIADLSNATDDLPPRFRPLERVQQLITGSGQLVVKSPPLPTSEQGPFAVQFVVEQPLGIAISQLRYTVISPVVPEDVRLLSPPVGATLSNATVFRWTGKASAAHYRLEFLKSDAVRTPLAGDQLIAGVDVEGTATEAQVLPFTLDTLSEHRPVWWRVVVLDARGVPVATSSRRRLGLPGSPLSPSAGEGVAP